MIVVELLGRNFSWKKSSSYQQTNCQKHRNLEQCQNDQNCSMMHCVPHVAVYFFKSVSCHTTAWNTGHIKLCGLLLGLHGSKFTSDTNKQQGRIKSTKLDEHGRGVTSNVLHSFRPGTLCLSRQLECHYRKYLSHMAHINNT